ncbi:glutamate-5-semialdehyde dehydrogenase [Parvularcula dongshanensis]|uniref:Gamma-glutamyl phosphate reductase n=1 Tax=Parvularcula dongshanensis TaxID=1173995 RepID=A0A840I577_9PROT|nr:glutamate-5-semialdehyde dehydrogenase [Parvularcula dongshanensis]MBB4660116.1 glutamate-5-semialdehyde dehydrogenase [Parvularcula dongshanensis]
MLDQAPETEVSDAEAHIEELGRRARAASRVLAAASTEQKNEALKSAARALRAASEKIVAANEEDVAGVLAAGKSGAFVDRLKLDEARVEGVAAALDQIADLPDPVGRVLAKFERPNGLLIERVATPLGVIGMIYESRPNVGADAGALCVKSGNAVILRGGSESRRSTEVIVNALRAGLAEAGLPEDCIQAVGTTDRAAVAALLRATEFIDLVIPRGGRGLVSLVRDQARVPTLLHLDGNCHTYIHADADLQEAAEIVTNAKLRRTGICGATESLVVDRAVVSKFVPLLLDTIGQCEVRGDEEARAADDRIVPATEEDWNTEYLDSILSVKTVEGPDEAIAWVQKHSSGHTDAVLTEDAGVAERFLNAIDSAVVMHNASTQFSDGGEFGMGAEIGIATGKVHARGPVGLEQLTTFKYRVHGDGQTRP